MKEHDMRKTLATILAATAVIAAACGGGTASPSPTSGAPASAAATTAAPKPPIKLGALLPLTGPSGATGLDMKDGYELAKEQINAAGGVNGAKIEVIYEDDKNDPATAVASFEKLANNDKVEVMMGGLASTISAALIEPAKKAGIPMAWTGAAATAVEKGFVDQSFFFHYHPWEYQNATSALAFLKSTPYKTFAVVYEDGLFGTGAADGFKTTLPAQGQTLAISEAFKTGSTDFTALLNRVKAKNPEALILVPFAGDVIPFLTQMREVGYKPKIVYASPPSFPANFGASPVAEGVAGLTLWTEDIPAPASKKFVADFKAKYNHTPVSYWSALAFTNIMTAVDALKKSGTGNKAAWITAMEATSYASPVGPTLKFGPSQFIKHQGFTSLVSFQWQGGKQQIVFPADLSTAPLK
jgi:branched-chain amino acid transport system substrate-binding protein